MEKPKHIVCLALPAWEAEYLRSTVELMKGAAQSNLVLYVDYAYTISDCIKGMLGKKKFEWKRLLGIEKRLRQVSGNTETGLYVLSLPPVFPAFKIGNYTLFKLASRFNAAFTGYFINRAIKKLQMQDVIAFNSFQPFLGLYWKIRNQVYSVYYIYDDFSNVPWFKGFAKIEEEKFIEQTDLIIVSSNELKKRKLQFNKPVEVVYNGVHFQSFFNYLKLNGTDTAAVKTIGYTGTMDFRIDIDLLEYVVREMQGARFLFVGKVFDKPIYTRLGKYSNVTFQDPVAPEMIPKIQSQLDIGIIPYVCSELTAAIYPLKANEYLAMGLPVVMTPFASIGEADEVVYVAKTAVEFKQDLEGALLETNDLLKQKRCAIAKKADWASRSERLMTVIDEHMAGQR